MQRHPVLTDTELYHTLLREDFMAFVDFAFSVLYPQTKFVDSPHLDIVATKLQECAIGKCRRLILCLPPRSLKSFITSVCLPAWVLGREPHREVVCASYGQELSDKFARDTRLLMSSPEYGKVFPTRLSPQRSAVSDFKTTANGSRMATSVGGQFTGRGGEIIIIDDPLKPAEALSETARGGVNHWFDDTVRSRLNRQKDGVIILVMQRLHQDDLVGHLLEKEEWEVLRFPAIAEEDQRYESQTPYRTVVYTRTAGEVLDPEREPLETLQQLRRAMGEYAFSAQYQQDPQPVGGAIVKAEWLKYYDPQDLPSRFDFLLQSVDTASKVEHVNDWSVFLTLGVLKKDIYVLDVFRRRLEYPDLRYAAIAQYAHHRPRLVLIEDKGSGMQLLQDLRREGVPVRPYVPTQDKQMRAYTQSAAFERGNVWLPQNAPWTEDYVRELTTFPGAKHDDQVDATTQALEFLANRPLYTFSIHELRM